MVKKLKSILRPILWSLALKAFVFGAGWLLLPLWAFLLLALLLYLFPLFQTFKLLLHFAILLFFMATTSPGFLAAIFFSAVFYTLLGIKDLLFIDKGSMYEVLLFLIVFMYAVRFYFFSDARTWIFSIIYIILFGVLLFFLSRGFFNEYSALLSGHAQRHRLSVSLFTLAFLLCQLIFLIAVLPLNFFYQTAIFFLSAVVLIESIFSYLCGTLTSRKILSYFSVFLVFMVFILGFAPLSL